MEIFNPLGRAALGTQIRYLSEKITADAGRVYGLYGIDMNPKWFPVFYALLQQGEDAITSVARAIGHSHVSVSKIVREMAQAGLVATQIHTADRRRTMVRLTAQGKRIAKKIEHQFRDVRSAMNELAREANVDLWQALKSWDELISDKSIYDRVLEKKNQREKIVIVPYRRQYHAAFRDLNIEWITKYFKMERADHAALDRPHQYILKPGGAIFIALQDGKAVGTCALLKRRDPHYPWELAKMAVAPKARGQGVGLMLGHAVIAKARAQKARRLYLESNTLLKPALALYRKLGFQRVTGLSTPYERCNIQMELNLSARRSQ